jgi:hypothetical protein
MATPLDQTIEAIGTGPVALVTSDAHDIESAEQAAEDDGTVAGYRNALVRPQKGRAPDAR